MNELQGADRGLARNVGDAVPPVGAARRPTATRPAIISTRAAALSLAIRRVALCCALLACTSCADRPAPVGAARGAVVAYTSIGVHDSPPGSPPWTRVGPGGGGAQFNPTIQPGNPDTALVTSDVTGTYLTRDGGQSWRMIKLDANTESVTFDPAEPSTIYAGNNNGTLYRSADTGDTWSLVYPNPSTVTGHKNVGDHAELELISTDPSWVGPTSILTAVAVDADNHDRLFMAAGASGGVLVLTSPDAGQTWSTLCSLSGFVGFGGFVRLFVDPTSPLEARDLLVLTTSEAATVNVASGTVTSIPLPGGVDGLTDASVGIYPPTGRPVLYVTSGLTYDSDQSPAFATGAYRSFNLGKSWVQMLAGLKSGYVPGTELTYHRIATCPTDASVVYMASQETTDGGNFGIMKSTNHGASWTSALVITNPVNRTLGWIERDFTPDWGGAPLAMAVASDDPDVLYATDWGTTYRTVDGGASWQELYCDNHPDGTVTTRGLDVSNSNTIVFDPFDHDHVALVNSSDIGLFASHDGGTSWAHAMSGVPAEWTNSVYSVVFDPGAPGRAWSAWSSVHDLPRYRYIRQSATNPGAITNHPGGICSSYDGMATWLCGDNGLPDLSVVTSLALDPASLPGSRVLYATVLGRGVYKSTDDGANWEPRNAGIESNGLNADIYAWQILMSPDGTLYLLIARSARPGTSSKTANRNVATVGALYRSGDGAATWTEVTLPDGVVFPNNMAIDPQHPQTAYLACWPQTLEPAHEDRFGGLYRTTDGGTTWTLVLDDRTHVYGVAVHPLVSARVFATVFEGAVLRSDDGGDSWARLGGFDFKWPKNPMLDPFNLEGPLYVTTFGGGVWVGSQDGNDEVPPDIVPPP